MVGKEELIYHNFCIGCEYKNRNIHKYGILCAVVCGMECNKYNKYKKGGL